MIRSRSWLARALLTLIAVVAIGVAVRAVFEAPRSSTETGTARHQEPHEDAAHDLASREDLGPSARTRNEGPTRSLLELRARDAESTSDAIAKGRVLLRTMSGRAALRTRVELRPLLGSDASREPGEPLHCAEHEDGDYEVTLPPGIEWFRIDAGGEWHVPLERTVSRRELLAGLTLHLAAEGDTLIEGTLVNEDQQPFTRTELEALFGAGRNGRPIPELRSLGRTESEWHSGRDARVDFDQSSFVLPVRRGFDGTVLLLEGDRIAAESKWADGGGTIQLVVDLNAILAVRGSLRVRLESTEPIVRLSAELHVVRSFPDDFGDYEIDGQFATRDEGHEIVADGIAPGTYVAAFRAAETRVVEVTIDVAPGERVERTVRVPTHVDVILPVLLESAHERARWESSARAWSFELHDGRGEHWPSIELRHGLVGGAPALMGELPVGSWTLVHAGVPYPIVVGPHGIETPAVLRPEHALAVRFRVGPMPLGGDGRSTAVRILVRDPRGTPLSCTYTWTHPNAARDVLLHASVPPGRSSIEILGVPFQTIRRELDLSEIPAEPLDVRLR